MNNKISTLVIIAVSQFIIIKADAQTWVDKLEKYPDIKTKGVYVVLNDTTSEVNKAYWNIYKKYWTYSSVNFLPYADMDNYLKPGNYFFTMMREKNVPTGTRSSYWKADYNCTLQLWEFTGKNKSSTYKKEEILNGGFKHVTTLGTVALFSTEKQSYYAGTYREDGEPAIPKLKFYTDCNYAGLDGTGTPSYFNWSEGLLKNYLQGMSSYAEQHKSASFNGDIYEKEKMELLKHDTLFVPDFAFVQYGLLNTGQEIPTLIEKKQNVKTAHAQEKQNAMAIFRKYKYPYKVISADELSKKLLTSTKPFYYLLYIVSCTDKLLTITYSENGENIYFTWSTKGDYSFLNLKEIKLHPDDIEKLAKKMEEK